MSPYDARCASCSRLGSGRAQDREPGRSSIIHLCRTPRPPGASNRLDRLETPEWRDVHLRPSQTRAQAQLATALFAMTSWCVAES